jgi:hypothetical protein
MASGMLAAPPPDRRAYSAMRVMRVTTRDLTSTSGSNCSQASTKGCRVARWNSSGKAWERCPQSGGHSPQAGTSSSTGVKELNPSANPAQREAQHSAPYTLHTLVGLNEGGARGRVQGVASK